MSNTIDKLSAITQNNEKHLVKVHQTKLHDYKINFQILKKKEEEITNRLQLLNPFVEREEEERSRLDILVDEKISLAHTNANADAFIE